MDLDEATKLHLQIDRVYSDLIRSINDKESAHIKSHKEMIDQIQAVSEQNKRQFQMLEPMYKLFENVSGFNSIAVWILKGLALIGAGLGVLYAFLKWLKA